MPGPRLTATFCLFMPQRSSSFSRRLHSWSRCEALGAHADSTHIKGTFWGCISCSTWGGRMGRTSWDQTGSAPCLHPHLRGTGHLHWD